MAVDSEFIMVLDRLRVEFAELEQRLKNEDEAGRLRGGKEPTKPVFLRLPVNLLEKVDRNAKNDHRNRQSYVIKVLSDATDG